MTSPPAARPATVLGTLGAACAALLALCGCEKPTPLATVTVGGDSVHTEAACYDDGRRIPPARLRGCLRGADGHVVTVGLQPAATVRFGVDPGIADRGWTVLLNGRPLTGTSRKTYRTIPGDVFFSPRFGVRGPTAAVDVLEGGGGGVTGLWSFTFRRKT